MSCPLQDFFIFIIIIFLHSFSNDWNTKLRPQKTQDAVKSASSLLFLLTHTWTFGRRLPPRSYVVLPLYFNFIFFLWSHPNWHTTTRNPRTNWCFFDENIWHKEEKNQRNTSIKLYWGGGYGLILWLGPYMYEFVPIFTPTLNIWHLKFLLCTLNPSICFEPFNY